MTSGLGVLLIEEDDAEAGAFEAHAERMQSLSFRLTRARTLTQAATLIHRGAHDLVFLGVRLADAGAGVSTVSRALELSGPTPLIVVSGLQDDAIAAEAFRRGADGFLSTDELSGRTLERSARNAVGRARQRALHARREALLRGALAATPDLVAVVDGHGKIEWVSDAWRQVAKANGGPAHAYLGDNYLEVCARSAAVGAVGAREAQRLIERILEGSSLGGELDYECERGGTTLRFAMIARRMPGKSAGALLSHHETTQVWDRAREQERSQASFRALIDLSPDGVAILSAGRVVYANAALARFLELHDASALVGRDPRGLVAPEDAERLMTWLATTHAAGEGSPLEVRLATLAPRVLQLRGAHVSYGDQPSVVIHGRDLTEARALAAQAFQLDRAITTGMLAAGVGHEINNPLTYVLTNLELVQESLEDASADGSLLGQQHDLRELVREARAGADKVQRIVADLRSLGQAPSVQDSHVSLNDAMSIALRMSSNQLRHRAQVTEALEADLPDVLGDQGRLVQVFTNLLVNAAYAVRDVRNDSPHIVARTYRMGADVVAEVEDNGPGIPEAQLGRVFEPFFTTKGKDGSGLGLAICRDVVTAHRGTLTVVRESNRTVFRVRLPAMSERAAAVELVGAAPHVATPSARILVIDDEPLVARAVQRALEPAFQVDVVSGGLEAIERLRAGRTYDLILCDVTMPGMNGPAVRSALQQNWPDTLDRFAYTTGGALAPSEALDPTDLDVPVISKPFSVSTLRARVTELLARLGQRAD